MATEIEVIGDLLEHLRVADRYLTYGTDGPSWASTRGQVLATMREARALLAAHPTARRMSDGT